MTKADFKLWISEQYHFKEGYAIWLVIRKDNKRKTIATGFYAEPHQWDDANQILVNDKRVPNLHPNRKRINEWITQKKVDIINIIDEFEKNRIDWTLNQFEAALFNHTNKGNVQEYFERHIKTLCDTDHYPNARCYISTLHMLSLFDKKLSKRVFPEIDLKYIKEFDIFLQSRKCAGNTRKYYHKTLRAILNQAIKDKEATRNTYPYGTDGFSIGILEEETLKRYITIEDFAKVKNTVMKNYSLELTRRLFLALYYCYGISFRDAATLTTKNIITLNRGEYIIYKRSKTKEARRVKPIQILINKDVREQLDWFKENSMLVGDYIFPIISKNYEGIELYKHIRSRCSRVNKNLKLLAKELEITKLPLTTYVARHTMAMTLQENGVVRDVISQIMGHSDPKITKTYLDSFESKIIEEAANLL